MYRNRPYSDWYVYRSRITLCTEVVIDMYRSSLYRCTEAVSPDVPKWSCTDLVLPQIEWDHAIWLRSARLIAAVWRNTARIPRRPEVDPRRYSPRRCGRLISSGSWQLGFSRLDVTAAILEILIRQRGRTFAAYKQLWLIQACGFSHALYWPLRLCIQ